MKKALITGITGQDGSYLAELLLSKGYMVYGIIRRSSSFNTERIDHIYKDIHENSNLRLFYGDMLDEHSIFNIIYETKPDEIYHLAAQSHVKVSFDIPIYTINVINNGILHVLNAVKMLRLNTKIYNASSSEMFGETYQSIQNEDTPFNPQSPYACAKVYAHYQCINYRKSYNMFVSNGILYNHESERRKETFVTRKITRAATRIKIGLQDKLYLGNLDSKRDWGYAPEYIKAMWMMLQSDFPGDYIIATGKTYTVRNFVKNVFSILDMDWKKYVEIDDRYLRPSEVPYLCGDSRKAQKELGWKNEVDFKQLVKIMVEHDLKLAEKEKKYLEL